MDCLVLDMSVSNVVGSLTQDDLLRVRLEGFNQIREHWEM